MRNEKIVKYACYTSSVSMAILCNVPPMLFITFHDLYRVSYSMLGLLVLINFVTQLLVDIVFSFFSHRFNIHKTVKLMPLVTLSGLILFALAPLITPSREVVGLIIGTVVFSIAGGLCEVLTSPIIAALPSDNPEMEMSKLHSVYAWGTVGVVILSTLFLLLFDNKRWQWLPFLYIAVPLCAFLLFFSAKIPALNQNEPIAVEEKKNEKKLLLLCVLAIFFCGAAECTMAQWSSGYLERVLTVSKAVCDILGVAMFGVMLGLGRTLYAKLGGHISNILLFGSIFAGVCYIIVALCPIPAVTIVFCALCGLAVSMLWPGTLILMAKVCPGASVVAYALMAAGGDLGASVGPQLVGYLTDLAVESEAIASFAANIGLTAEVVGMKGSMLICAVFPFLGSVLLWVLKRKERKISTVSITEM